jgi:hypothetical protein
VNDGWSGSERIARPFCVAGNFSLSMNDVEVTRFPSAFLKRHILRHYDVSIEQVFSRPVDTEDDNDVIAD